MITFRQYLDESINDKGILKALFIVGIPGAGKSYTVRQLSGAIAPRVVNTDKVTEFLSQKFKIPSNNETWNSFFKDRTKPLTTSLLTNYLNGMLPLFIDGTSNDTGNILSRVGILESIGYDVGMVFISTKLEVAKERAAQRAAQIDRHVSDSFIEHVYQKSEENRAYFESKFGFYREINNNPGELDDAAIMKIYRQVAGFYAEPVKNPVGTRTLEKLQEQKQKYIVPALLSEEQLKKKVAGWFRS